MEALFEVGQKVVALGDQPQGCYKEGQEFTVISIKKICCYVCIQIHSQIMSNHALVCDCGNKIPSNILYFNQINFAPINEIGNMTFEEAIGLVTQKEMV